MPAEDILDFRDPADRALYHRRLAAELRYETLGSLRDELERLGAMEGLRWPRRSRLQLIHRLADARMAKATGLTLKEIA
jgi:hypothetical protein